MGNKLLIANRFELQDLLGRGARSVGDVYCAFDTQTGETVAVKALNLEILERDLSISRSRKRSN